MNLVLARQKQWGTCTPGGGAWENSLHPGVCNRLILLIYPNTSNVSLSPKWRLTWLSIFNLNREHRGQLDCHRKTSSMRHVMDMPDCRLFQAETKCRFEPLPLEKRIMPAREQCETKSPCSCTHKDHHATSNQKVQWAKKLLQCLGSLTCEAYNSTCKFTKIL